MLKLALQHVGDRSPIGASQSPISRRLVVEGFSSKVHVFMKSAGDRSAIDRLLVGD